MNSNPGTHNGIAGLEKEVHRSTDRVHPEKACTSLSQAAATGCLAPAVRVPFESYFAQRAALAKSGCWSTLNGALWSRNLNARNTSACLWDAALVGELCPKIWKMPYPCDRDADGDNGARAEQRSLLFLISHLMDALI